MVRYKDLASMGTSFKELELRIPFQCDECLKGDMKRVLWEPREMSEIQLGEGRNYFTKKAMLKSLLKFE